MQVTNDTMRRVPPNGRIAVVAVLIGIAVVPNSLRRRKETHASVFFVAGAA